MHFEAR